MLFDLRSRGRRRAVQVIYGVLALIMVSGLLLVGVGTGNGGGILNAFTNNGSNSGQKAAVDAQTKAALTETKKDPNSAAAWAALAQARFTAAGEGSNFDTATGTYTASGKKQLKAAAPAWSRYLQLTGDKPDISIATLMAEAFAGIPDYASEASAWEYVAAAAPNEPKGFMCLAFSAYAAKQTRKAELAAASALALTPKIQQVTVKSELTQAKSDGAAYAQSC